MTKDDFDQGLWFDKGPSQRGSAFQSPLEVIEAHDVAQVQPALAAMENAQQNGKWLAGVVSYELGYVFVPKIAQHMPRQRQEPLLRFGVFDQFEAINSIIPSSKPPKDAFEIEPLAPSWDFERYQHAFKKLHQYIKNGDIYQANLTFGLQGQFHGNPLALYHALLHQQPVPHGVFVKLADTLLLSRSPELFFSLTSEGTLKARPMKGTSKRAFDTQEDERLKKNLAKSSKDRAENLMITDLLRNDLGRISKIGTVKVPKIFEVETYATLHQMTSEVVSQIKPEHHRIGKIFEALFPCGSITGAPKRRAMEILNELEMSPRESYCGAIGWIAPSGAMEFNVAIRTAILNTQNQLILNVGGGVVFDSSAKKEYQEALLKATFLTNLIQKSPAEFCD